MFRGVVIAALAIGLLVPASASAARPAVDTGGAASITDTGAALNGSVNPRGKETTYFFQYGLNRLYGAQTGPISAGAANGRSRVSVPVGGLTPATRYHYRLVARNADGMTLGADRTFKTKVQPLGVTLTASPVNPQFNSTTALTGTLSGTNRAGRQVVLQASQYPFSAGFANFGNPVVTDANGNFTFNSLVIPVNTQFRVLMPQRPDVVSPVVFVGAGVQVRTDNRKTDQGRRSKVVKFFGSITPATTGAKVYLQKNVNGAWVNKKSSRSKPSGSNSRFAIFYRLYKPGQFRIVADSAQPQYSQGLGRTITVARVRR